MKTLLERDFKLLVNCSEAEPVFMRRTGPQAIARLKLFKKCQKCDGKFILTVGHQRFCSERCRKNFEKSRYNKTFRAKKSFTNRVELERQIRRLTKLCNGYRNWKRENRQRLQMLALDEYKARHAGRHYDSGCSQLSDNYLIHLLIRDTELRKNDVPKSIIKLKRNHLQLLRALRKQKGGKQCTLEKSAASAANQ